MLSLRSVGKRQPFSKSYAMSHRMLVIKAVFIHALPNVIFGTLSTGAAQMALIRKTVLALSHQTIHTTYPNILPADVGRSPSSETFCAWSQSSKLNMYRRDELSIRFGAHLSLVRYRAIGRKGAVWHVQRFRHGAYVLSIVCMRSPPSELSVSCSPTPARQQNG